MLIHLFNVCICLYALIYQVYNIATALPTEDLRALFCNVERTVNNLVQLAHQALLTARIYVSTNGDMLHFPTSH